MSFYGNFGAAAGGVTQGVQAAQEQQMNNMRIQQQQQQARDDAALSSIAALGFQDWLGAKAKQPAPQSPPPGQASVPMAQPGEAQSQGAGAPAQGGAGSLPLYRAISDARGEGVPPQMPMQNVSLDPKPTPAADAAPDPYDPRVFQAYVTEGVSKLKASGASGRAMQAWAASETDKYKEAVQERRAAEKDALNQKNIESLIASRNKGEYSDEFEKNGKTYQYAPNGKLVVVDKPQSAGRAGGTGGTPSAGNFNQLLRMEQSALGAITKARQSGAEIITLLDSGDPAATSQVQQLLTRWLNSSHTTNQQYGDNKSFGNVEQRFANSINRFLSGKYSSEDKAQIKAMVREMDKKVFDPAQETTISNYQKAGKASKYSPEQVDALSMKNAFPTAAPAATPPGLPPGFTVME